MYKLCLVFLLVACIVLIEAQLTFTPDWGQGKRSGGLSTAMNCRNDESIATIYRMIQGRQLKQVLLSNVIRAPGGMQGGWCPKLCAALVLLPLLSLLLVILSSNTMTRQLSKHTPARPASLTKLQPRVSSAVANDSIIPNANQTVAMQPTTASLVVLTKGVQVVTPPLYVSGHHVAHPELCPQQGAGLGLLVVVWSVPAHQAARKAVRRTWGSFAGRRDLALVFIIGQPSKIYQKAVAREDALYGDVIQGNWVHNDSSPNLAWRTVSMLEWCDSYCPRTRRVLKMDDDVFANIPRLLRFLGERRRNKLTRTIWGQLGPKQKPTRKPKKTPKYPIRKTNVSLPLAVSPFFSAGPGYILTADCVQPLLQAALAKHATVTGVLADTLAINQQGTREFAGVNVKKAYSLPCAVKRHFFVHRVTPEQQYELWSKLHEDRKC